MIYPIAGSETRPNAVSIHMTDGSGSGLTGPEFVVKRRPLFRENCGQANAKVRGVDVLLESEICRFSDVTNASSRARLTPQVRRVRRRRSLLHAAFGYYPLRQEQLENCAPAVQPK